MPVTLNLPPQMVERAREMAEAREMDLDALIMAALSAYLDDDQAWYWTDEWQAAENEAEIALSTGNYKTFDSMDDLLADLMADDQ
jgi:predicted transcriptional regulator